MPKEMMTAKPNDFKVDNHWFHLIPMGSPEDSAILRGSIEKRGVVEPITVLPDMTILDGYQRWTIVKHNPTFSQNIPYEIREDLADVAKEEIIDFILLRNLERRHLTSWQKVNIFETVIKTLTDEGKERRLANLKQGDEDPDTDPASVTGKMARTIIAEKYGIPEETQKLKKAIDDSEDYDTKGLLDQGEISQREAWRRVRKDQNKSEAAKEKPLFYLIKRGEMNWKRFFVVIAAITKQLFKTSAAKEVIRMRIDFPEKKEADAVDKDSNKAWKPIPFKGWACAHNVAGGCWRCFPDLAETGHQRKTAAHKAEEVHIPVDRKELSGFTVLPDKDLQACHKCDLYDRLNGNCEWEEGFDIPEVCKKLAHRR